MDQETELKDELEATQSAHAALGEKYAELLAEHQALKDEHAALLKVLPKGMKKVEPHVYGPDECEPVPTNGTCAKCGWQHGSPEPHVI